MHAAIAGLAVIGAGPAGMSAAILAAQHGASVVLLDEQDQAGGQIYRNVLNQNITDKNILGDEYYAGLKLGKKLAASRVDHQSGATVWQVSQDREIGVSQNGAARLLNADQIIIATGAMERPFPIPGWTLPGVMNAGAAQILLKSSGVTIPNAVFVGTGPLLYLIAHQYLQAGVAIKAVIDTTPGSNYFRALPYLPSVLTSLGGMNKGRSWIKSIRSSGVPFFKGVSDVELLGDEAVTAVRFKRRGQWQELETQHVFLHQGVVPNTNLAMAAGCKHSWHYTQLCWHADVDQWMESDIPGIAIAGDGAGITGAIGSEHSGRIAALGALFRCGKIDAGVRDNQSRPLFLARGQEVRMRPFLDVLFRPADNFRIPAADATVVCRCEEVSAGEIRAAVDEGCQGPNQLKSFTRCGMGPCQGRMCGLTVSEIIAESRDVPVDDVGAYRLRPPVKPLMLGELASLNFADDQSLKGH